MNTQEGQATPCEGTWIAREDRVPLQTVRRSFEQICAGEEPWIALGNFLHQFFGHYKHRREELVCDPLEVLEQHSIEQFRWAVFCAASVEHLCARYVLPCPGWALHPCYTLEEPWYHGIGADLPQVQEELRTTTPEEFSRRNIFCGDRTFRTKYEHEGRRGRQKPA